MTCVVAISQWQARPERGASRIQAPRCRRRRRQKQQQQQQQQQQQRSMCRMAIASAADDDAAAQFPREPSGVVRGAAAAAARQRQRCCRARASIGRIGDAEEKEGNLREALIGNPVMRFLTTMAKFSRPHTIYGTAISVLSVSFVAAGNPSALLHWSLGLKPLVVSLVSALLANVAIVGLNQVYDVHIDKVNKPYLPLASGEMTLRTATGIIAVTAIAAVCVSAILGSWPLTITIATSLLLGVVYSADIPRGRWKSNPVLAAACIFCVRAVLVQIGFSMHMSLSLGLGWALPKAIQFALVFMCILSVVIACFKDLPDIRGDREAGIMTFGVRDGPEKVFRIALALITVAYTYAIGMGFLCPILWRKVAIVCSHSLLLWLAWDKTNEVTDFSDSGALMRFYMFIWKLFYAEYLLLPLVV